MAHGAPDDSNIRKETDVYRLDDMADLAVRLGSIYAYHRQGDVLFLEDFESGLNAWEATVFGVAGEIALTNDVVLAGTLSCRCDSGTGALPYVRLRKYLSLVNPGKMGVQISFTFDSNVKYIVWGFYYEKDAVQYAFLIGYTHTTGVLEYNQVGTGVYVFATPGPLVDSNNTQHNFKVIVDTEEGEYIKCLIDETEYDMSGYESLTAVGTLGDTLGFIFQVWGDGDTSGTLYLDNIILTFNET